MNHMTAKILNTYNFLRVYFVIINSRFYWYKLNRVLPVKHTAHVMKQVNLIGLLARPESPWQLRVYVTCGINLLNFIQQYFYRLKLQSIDAERVPVMHNPHLQLHKLAEVD